MVKPVGYGSVLPVAAREIVALDPEKNGRQNGVVGYHGNPRKQSADSRLAFRIDVYRRMEVTALLQQHRTLQEDRIS